MKDSDAAETPQIELNNRRIGADGSVFVIAEIGHNHQGNLQTCKELFIAAKHAGADAVKLQKRDNKSLFTREAYNQAYNSENAYRETYGEHREFLEFGRDEYQELKQFAGELGICFFSTAFDIPSADFLENVVDPPFYKLASADVVNAPLVRHVASFGKPIILSTGGATLEDVRRAYDLITPINRQLAILQCTASYPCETENLNLRVIETFRREFPDAVVGFSSHHSGISMELIAYMLGARIFEKHFTLNRTWKGTDQSFSLTPEGFRRMVRDLHRVPEALGDGVKKRLLVEEKPLIKMAKSLVAARDLAAGHVLTDADIAARSPGGGLEPYHVDKLVGRSLNRTMATDQMFTWDDVDATK